MRLSGMELKSTCWSLLEVGEHTGKLGESMSRVGEMIRDGENRRKDLVGQLWYPGFVFLAGIIVMALILVWVIPQMRELGETMGMQGDLPWLTENIGILYGSLLMSILLVALGACGTVYFWSRAARRFEFMGRYRESLLKWIPVLGNIWRGRREADIQQQLANLLRGGITLPRSLEILSELRLDRWEKDQLLDFRKRLIMGAGFEASVERFAFFNRDSISLLVSGQESGQLDEFLFRLSDEGERLVFWKLKQLIRLVEPLMLVSLSGAIGGLVMAYLLPMVRMFEQLSL